MFPGLLAAIALLAGAPSADSAEDVELVVLPLEAEGVKPQVGIDAWKVVVDEIEKSRSKLKVSLKIQKANHEMLLGPARERAKDCGGNPSCLREIGGMLEASIIVVGKVTKDAVSLTAVEVASGQRLGLGRSPGNVADAAVDKKARLAVNILIATFSLGKSKKAAASAEKGEKKKRDVSDKSAGSETPEIDTGVKTSTRTVLASKPVSTEPPKSEPPPAKTATSGASAAQPAQSARTDLVPAPVQPAEEPVTSKWWFWTGIGAAVLAGSALVVILAGGTKGGPTVPSDSGAIQGTY